MWIIFRNDLAHVFILKYQKLSSDRALLSTTIQPTLVYFLGCHSFGTTAQTLIFNGFPLSHRQVDFKRGLVLLSNTNKGLCKWSETCFYSKISMLPDDIGDDIQMTCAIPGQLSQDFTLLVSHVIHMSPEHHPLWDFKLKQECIPMGCVLPACWLYPSMHCTGGVCPGQGVWLGVSAQWGCLPRGCLPRGVSASGPRGYPSMQWGRHPPVSFAGGEKVST